MLLQELQRTRQHLNGPSAVLYSVQCTYCGPSCLVSNAIRNIAVNEGSRKNTQLFSSKTTLKTVDLRCSALATTLRTFECTVYCISAYCIQYQGGVIQHFLQFSKSYTFPLIRFIFKRSIASHARQSFPFQKIAGTFENFFF